MIANIERVLTPLDGSPEAEQGLPLAMYLSDAFGADLHVAHVFVPMAVTATGRDAGVADAAVEQAAEGAHQYLRQISESVKGTTQRAVHAEFARARTIRSPFAETRRVVEALRELANRLPADLVVMTTHGRGGVSRVWLGSVADALIREVNAPVLLVRLGAEPRHPTQPVRHVLIPLDGSELAEGIIPLAAALAARAGARVTLLRVLVAQRTVAHLAPVSQIDQEHLGRLEAEANRYLTSTRRRLADMLPGTETCIIVDEKPAFAILHWAAENGVDLIAMATHGLSGFNRLMLGSIADKVVRGATVPVLLQTSRAQAKLDSATASASAAADLPAVSRDDDAELRRRVLEWIDWEPGLRGSEIAVTSKDGTITLSGYVNSLAQKRMAERDSARVLGVRVIADDLRVRQLPERERAHDMLHAVQHALDSDLGVPSGSVIAVVADDWVTLEGTVEREQQKVAAERRVAHVEGVRGITNGIQVRSMVASTPVPPERAAQERVAPTG